MRVGRHGQVLNKIYNTMVTAAIVTWPSCYEPMTRTLIASVMWEGQRRRQKSETVPAAGSGALDAAADDDAAADGFVFGTCTQSFLLMVLAQVHTGISQ